MNKSEYYLIMKETEFGYLADESEPYYCPTDIEGVTEEDLHDDAKRCKCNCMFCWKHVIDTKKWEE